MPVCVFLSRLPKEEVQSLKADLIESWNHVNVEPPYVRDFYYIPWSNILGTSATLRQVYYLVKQTHHRTGRSTCLLLDAMSALTKEAWLAHFEIDDLSQSAQCIIKCEQGLETPRKVHFELQIQDPDKPIGPSEGLDREMMGSLDAGLPDIALGHCALFSNSPIFCIARLSNSDIDDFKAKLDQGPSSKASSSMINTPIVPWSGERKATRAMIYDIATKAFEAAYARNDDRLDIIMLDEQTMIDGNLLCVRFIKWSPRPGLEIARVPATAIRIIPEEFRPSLELDGIRLPKAYLGEDAYRETIWNPNMPLCVRNPL